MVDAEELVEKARYTFWSRFLRGLLPRHVVVELEPETVDALQLASQGVARIDRRLLEGLLERIDRALEELGRPAKVFVRNDQTSCKVMIPGFGRRTCVEASPEAVLRRFIETLECTMPWFVYRERGWVGLDAPPARALVIEECLEIARWDDGLLGDSYYGRVEARAAVVGGEVVEIWPYYRPGREIVEAILKRSRNPRRLLERYLAYLEAVESDEALWELAREAARRLPRDLAWSVDLAYTVGCGWVVIDAAPLALSDAPCRGYAVLLAGTGSSGRDSR